jgi:hypothetical protein
MAKARYLKLWKEEEADRYKFPDTVPESTATPICPRLIGDDAFSMLPDPQFVEIRSADSYNMVTDIEPGRLPLKGKLSTYLYWDQIPMWLEMVTDLFSSLEPKTYTARYFDSIRYYEFNGLTAEQMVLDFNATSDEGLGKVTIDFQGVKVGTPPDNTSFPMPAGADYPVGPIVRMSEFKSGSGVGVTLDTSTGKLANFKNLKLTFKNILSVNFEEDPKAPTDITWHGRDFTLETEVRDKAANSYRTWLEAGTDINLKLEAARGTTPSKRTLTLNFNGKNRLSAVGRTQPLGSPGYTPMTLRSRIDPSGSGMKDFAYTWALS